MKDLTTDINIDLNSVRDHHIAKLKTKLKAWELSNISPYKGKQHELSQKDLKLYKEKVMKYEVSFKSIIWWEKLVDKVRDLIDYTRMLEGSLKRTRAESIEKQEVHNFLNKIHKYKVIDESLSKPTEGLTKAQTAILYNEVRKLQSKLG